MQQKINILQKILARKADEIRDRKTALPERELMHRAADCPPTRDFRKTINRYIQAGKPAIIAEIKKASPSKGIICHNFNARKIAQSYANAGASCLSVLTDKDFFQGSDEYLKQAHAACELPILRKDFILTPYQIYESRTLSADCILLIVAALSDMQLQELIGIAQEIGIDILLEIHNHEELERGLALSCPLIGINNRNLHTFETDIQTTLQLLPEIPPDRTVITESGIHTPQHIQLMRQFGVHSFLIGESLMRAQDPGEKLKQLILA